MKKEKAMSVTITGYLEFSDLKDGKRYAQVLCYTPYPHIAQVTIIADQPSDSDDDLSDQVEPFWAETVTMECDVDGDTITTSAKRMQVVR